MNYTQHPLSAAYPSMSAEELEGRLDGVIPSPQSFYDCVNSSAWFKSLKKSQRALYVVSWYHWLKQGSNQYKRIVRTDTPRHASEQTQQAIQKAAA